MPLKDLDGVDALVIASADLLADRFLAECTADERRIALVLAVSDRVTRDDLRDVVSELWPDASSSDDTIAHFEALPFVTAGAHALKLEESVGSSLAARFQESDEAMFVAAHRALVATERAKAARDGISTEEHWFALAHLAYYLAPLEPGESSATFADAFESAPQSLQTECRLFLTRLALRQQRAFIGRHERTVDFFLGFRAYIARNERDARKHFDAVIATGGEDLYHAVALHLRARVERDSTTDQVNAMLRRSIAISRKRGLITNEVMARNTRIYALLAKAGAATGGGEASLLAEARAEAARNVHTSEGSGLENLITWATITYGVIMWNEVTGVREPYKLIPVSDRLRATLARDTLRKGLDLAAAARDVESMLAAINHLLQAEWQLGDPDEALTYLDQTRGHLRPDPSLDKKVTRLLQSVRRLQRVATGQHLVQLEEHSKALQAWLDRFGESSAA